MIIVLVRKWWMVALRGALALLLGLFALAWPLWTLQALVLVFGGYALVDGLLAAGLGLWAHGRVERWWTLLLEGLTGIAVGVVVFLWPVVTAFTLLYLVALWAIVTGVFELAAAVRLRLSHQGELLLALAGATSILLGLLIVLFPRAGVIAFAWMIAFYALTFGALMLAFAVRLRRLERTFSAARTPTLHAV